MSKKLLLMVVIGILSFLFVRRCFVYIENTRRVKEDAGVEEQIACNIPDIDPFSYKNIHLVKPGHIIRCAAVSLTYRHHTSIVVNKTAVARSKFKSSFAYCKYQAIYRPRFGKGHNYFHYLNESKPFNDKIDVKEEFVRVRCYAKSNKIIQTNFYAFMFPKVKKQRTPSDKSKYNVILLGIDSMSRLNSMRYIRRTRRLLRSIGCIEMTGYTAVGHNTFETLMPMLYGLPSEKLNWDPKRWWLTFDQNIFIWNKFQKSGFTTFYAEDRPDYAIFDFYKGGFSNIPTDFYNRHLSVAIWKEKHTKADYRNTVDEYCITDKTEADVILDYHLQFLETYRKHPHFSFIFLTQLTHDFAEYSASIDDILEGYIDKLRDRGHLKNTLFIVFGDHGMRWGHIRDSAIGGIEVKLPMMFVVPPPNLQSKHPEMLMKIQRNKALLTTPYDFHETLLDILQLGDTKYNDSTQNKKGLSIFRNIPRNRTCTAAGVPSDLCPCRDKKEVSISSKLRLQVKANVLRKINEILRPYLKVCHQLRLQNISKAFEFQTGSPGRAIEVVFITLPGNAEFQAEIKRTAVGQKIKIIGQIIRINKYGNQSHCVIDSFIKNYCFCKQQG